jgi:hypothetical protein
MWRLCGMNLLAAISFSVDMWQTSSLLSGHVGRVDSTMQ